MKNTLFKSSILLAIVTISMSSCAVKNKTATTETFTEHHSAPIALDWQGSYYGVLPCADCEGIKTELTLNEDLSYQLTEVWNKNGNVITERTNGTFSWQGNNIHLENIQENRRPSTFKVEENRIRQMDMNGHLITGDLASHYLLSKMGNAQVEDQRWQIVELYGKAIDGAAETHYVIFHSKEKRLEAKINCNVLLRDYKITHQYKLETGQGLSTMMACPDNLEPKLIKALNIADNISVNDSTLTLNKGRMAPLVVMKRVD